jgi:putative DNA-invertase from lambdoid prophage Rac
MNVASYSRVSTDHREQKPDAQVEELRRYCSARGWGVAHEIIDHGFSGGSDQRPGLQQVMALVRARQVDIVVVTKLDRLARSLKHLVGLLDEFSALGVMFVSLGDAIDLTTPSGRLMLHIVGAFAEFERSLVRDRTLAGLAQARSKGIRLGRPPKHDPERIRALRSQGKSYREIIRLLGASMGTVAHALRNNAQNTLPKPPCENPTVLKVSGD